MNTVEEQFTFFEARYGATIKAALQVYSERMNEHATEAKQAYEAIKDDPAKVVQQDQSLLTHNGMHHISLMCQEAAEKSDEAYKAWEDLTELLD